MHDPKESLPGLQRKLSHAEKDDGLEPVIPLDLGSIGSFDDLARAMSRTAFAVPYTHLTLPTIYSVELSVVAVSLKKYSSPL